MRRRASGSGEDEDATPPADGASDEAETGAKMREAPRMARQPPQRLEQDRVSSLAPQPSSDSTHENALEQAAIDSSRSSSSDGLINDAPDTLADYHRQQRARLRRPWTCSLLTLATTACSALLLYGIVRSFLTRQLDPKGCAMSYMMPAFARFTDFDTEHTRFASKYSLYLYREGGVDEDSRVKGIPVLFIPGNAGSYKQVRPIAAEAAHYFHDVLREDATAFGRGKRTLDFFTVDFNEELSAFHGQTLLDQAEYLNEAVAYILALYHNPSRSLREPGLPDPKSVIILGHSMGGVVARAMLRMPNYQEGTINTILTLSAPHARAPVSFDSEMVATYNKINTFWRRSFSIKPAKRNPLSEVTLVSVAGGGLDIMIPSEFSSLTSLVPDTHGFTVFTSAIPTVWTGMDHLAIMWCDQLRKALVKALYDVVDVRRPTQTLEQKQRIKAFRKRLLTGMESVVQKAELEQAPTTFLTLDHGSTSIMPHGQRLVLRDVGRSGTTQAHVMPIPVQPFVKGNTFTMLTDQVLDAGHDEGPIALLLCSVFPPIPGATGFAPTFNIDVSTRPTHSTRLACRNAATDVSYLPASTNESLNAFDPKRPFSYLQYDIANLHNYQFVAIVEKVNENATGWVVAEFSTAAESITKISRGHHQLLLNGLRLNLPLDRPMMTELKIPEVHSTLFTYRLRIKRKECESQTAELFRPLLRQYIQEPYESKYFVNTEGGNINVHGISPYMPPPLHGKDASEGLSLQLWTDPTCNSTVQISLKVDVIGSAGKLVMRYRTVFAAFPLLVIAIVLRKQFKVYDTTGVFMSFSQSLDQCLRTSVPAIIMALTFLTIALSKATHGSWTRKWLSLFTGTEEGALDLTVNDLLLGTSDPFFWFLIPLFGLISVGVCVAGNYVVLSLTHILAFFYGRLRLLVPTSETSSADSACRSSTVFNTNGPHHRLLITGALFLLVTTVVPYQFAYVVLCVVQIVTSTRALRTAQDAAATAGDGNGSAGQAYNFYNYAHSMLMLMLWILPINMPVLIVWVHNLAVHWLTPFQTHHNLLSVLPYVLLAECMSAGNMIPRVTSRLRYVTNISTFLLALYASVYGVTYAYRLHHLVNALCSWFFIVHLSQGPVSLAKLGEAMYKWREREDHRQGDLKKQP